MKRRRFSDIASVVLITTGFIGLANCGENIDMQEEKPFEISSSDSADYAISPSILGRANRVKSHILESGALNRHDSLASPRYGINKKYPGDLVGNRYFHDELASPFDFSLYVETNCTDGVDGDGDGLWDCQDPDCHIFPECSEFGPPLEELTNSRAVTIYPNGILVPEDLAILKGRGNDDDDFNGWQRDNFFAKSPKECWVYPREHDPYFNIPLGEGLVNGPFGPVGPLLDPGSVVSLYGPRAGLINECSFGTNIIFHHMDDDNGAGAGAAGDTDDDDGGTEDDQNDD